MLLWSLKQLDSIYKLGNNLCFYILTVDSSIREDMFLAMLLRIRNGIKRNCLVDCMKMTPLVLRQLIMERIYGSMIEALKELMMTIALVELTPEVVALVDSAVFEENFGETIRANIRARLGF